MDGGICWVGGGWMVILYRWVGVGEDIFWVARHFLWVGGGSWRYILRGWKWIEVFFG